MLDRPRQGEPVLAGSEPPSEPGERGALHLQSSSAAETGDTMPGVLRAYVLARRRLARRALDAELLRALSGTGFDASDICARELTAAIADLSTCELLQIIANGRKNATIELVHGSFISRIWCARSIPTAPAGSRSPRRRRGRRCG